MRGALAIACIATIAASGISCAAPGVEPSSRPRNEPANLACRFEAEDWHGDIGVSTLGDEPVAYVSGAKARLHVFVGESASENTLRLEREGSVIRGVATQPEIYFRRPVVLAEVLRPKLDGAVVVRGARRGVLSLSFEDLAGGWDTTLAEAPVFELSCGAFQLEIPEPEPDTNAGPPREWINVGPGVVPFSASPGGPPELAPRYDEARPGQQLERRGDWVRVRICELMGWVPASSVHRGEDPGRDVCSGDFLLSSHSTFSPYEAVICPVALPLFVARNGDRARLGTIAAGAEIRVHDDEHDGATVSLAWIDTSEGARLVVPALREASCVTTGWRGIWF